MRQSAIFTTLYALTLAGCAMSTDPRHEPPPPPPPATIDACPAGGTLNVLLWDVYATPRKPDGSVWDGVGSNTIELVCSVAASEIRSAVTDAINGQLAGAGTFAD